MNVQMGLYVKALSRYSDLIEYSALLERYING